VPIVNVLIASPPARGSSPAVICSDYANGRSALSTPPARAMSAKCRAV
jgi:hypothetical protein